MSKNIFFIGPASVGKTTVGKLLAQKIGYDFIDIDKVFCERVALIPDYIKVKGYAGYCETNSSLTDSLIEEHPTGTVFATPSGFLAHEDSPHLIKKHLNVISCGISVLLLPSPDPLNGVDAVVQRQSQRWKDVTPEIERERFLARFGKYKDHGDIKVFSLESPDLIADAICGELKSFEICYPLSMSTLLIDGRAARDAAMPGLIGQVKSLIRPPHLAIIQVGDRPDSTSYIKAKQAFAAKIGVKIKHVHVPESVTEKDLLEKIAALNADTDVQGIIVQLPLPLTLDRDAILEAVAPHKDADGLTSFNVKRWTEGLDGALMPATARGVKELLGYYKIDLFGKHVVVVGRSMLVGKPIAAYALNENATVTVVHSKTADLAEETRRADVLIVAAGRPKLINADHVREGTIVIDVGINTVKGEKLEDEIADKKLVGDVDFEAVQSIASAITPVPGGVGPMTVLGLFENLIDLCKN